MEQSIYRKMQEECQRVADHWQKLANEWQEKALAEEVKENYPDGLVGSGEIHEQE